MLLQAEVDAPLLCYCILEESIYLELCFRMQAQAREYDRSIGLMLCWSQVLAALQKRLQVGDLWRWDRTVEGAGSN